MALAAGNDTEAGSGETDTDAVNSGIESSDEVASDEVASLDVGTAEADASEADTSKISIDDVPGEEDINESPESP